MDRALYASISPSVIYVEVPGKEYSSGWVMEKGLIVTSEHSVRGATQILIRTSRYPPVTGEVIVRDSFRDIAFVKYSPDAIPLKPLPVQSLTEADVGEPVLVIGYSLPIMKADGTVGPPAIKQGILSQIVDKGTEGLLLRVDAAIDPGDSGGPVTNLRGQVVGVSRSAVTFTGEGQRVVGAFYAIHIGEVLDARKKWVYP